MHNAAKDFAMSRNNELGQVAGRKLADATIADADSVQQGLSVLITDALIPLERDWPTGLPRGVIHADLFPDNVLFMRSDVSGLIDFYFACNDSYAYDLAVMLNAWCFERDGSYNLTNGSAVLAALSPGARADGRRTRCAPDTCAWCGSALPAYATS